MHPGSTQAFGRLGPDGVPTFLFPSHPATALLLFEVLVRPLIRLALGPADPHRRLVTARLTSPVISIPGRRGYLRGRLLREQATGDYLVQPLGTSGTHLLSSLADCERPDRAARGRSPRRPWTRRCRSPSCRRPADGRRWRTRTRAYPGAASRAGRRGRGRAAGAGRRGRAAAGAAARRRRLVGDPDPRRAAPRAVGADHAGSLGAAARRRGVAGPVAAAARGRPARHRAAVRDHPRRRGSSGTSWSATSCANRCCRPTSATGWTPRVTGRGVMTAAVALAVDHCFGPVGLHRLEATVRPENARQPAGAGQARLPRGGAVPPLPRRRRRVARPLLLRADRRGAAGRAASSGGWSRRVARMRAESRLCSTDANAPYSVVSPPVTTGHSVDQG